MIIGVDIGASAVKIVGIDEEKVLFTHAQSSPAENLQETIELIVNKNGCDFSSVTAVGVTGVGAEHCGLTSDGYKMKIIPEIHATGEGATWLSHQQSAIVVSIGTGTSLVFADDGVFSHIGGSGVGSGTLRGISKKLFGAEDVHKLFQLAEGGNRLTVDITIGDLFSGTDTLPAELTASNLAKAEDTATAADWAYALINTVMEVAGSHAALACGGYGVGTVVITGGISNSAIAKKVYDGFSRLYKLNYIIPEYSDFATAIGAARRGARA